jgi:glycosyltransferase involved in cell wall biosynthesis
MPRLLIDGTPIHPNPKGIGRYSFQLCSQLAGLLPSDWLIHVLIHPEGVPVLSPIKRLNLVPVRRASEIWKGLWLLPLNARRLRPQILLKTDESLGRISGIPTVAVCHDIDELIWAAQSSNKGKVRHMVDRCKRQLRVRTLRGCQSILCNSEFIRDAVQRHYGIPLERLGIAYCAVDERFYSFSRLTNHPAVRKKYGVPGFVLAFATGDPRENFGVYPAIAARLVELGTETCLLIAGVRRGASYENHLKSEFLRLGLVEGRHFVFEEFLGGERFQELADLYTAADFYLDLSLHEGFGMQLVEAMACGTTCIASSRGALGEIGNRYARFVDPVDPMDVALNIRNAYQNGEGKRDNRPQIEYTRRFAWPRTARIVADALIQALTPSGRIL